MKNIPKPRKRPSMPGVMIVTPPKKHIATVADFFTDNFDEKVNNLIDNGYTLIKRELINPNNAKEKTYFYAELEKIIVEEYT